MGVLWSCPRVVGCVTVFGCFTYLRTYVLTYLRTYCQATVGESNGQSMRVASRCLWDKDLDTCAETTWTNVRAP
jgi:hypothetical protein